VFLVRIALLYGSPSCSYIPQTTVISEQINDDDDDDDTLYSVARYH